MHPEAVHFVNFVKEILISYFDSKTVLDVGGGDINGNNRSLFKNCNYNANDVIDAPNVTIVSKTKDLNFDNNYFDTIISTECFEHDPEYKESLKKIYELLKPCGLFVFTCAGYGRPEHGTRRTTPGDSYGTIGNLEDMTDYYLNLTIKDINNALNLDNNFIFWDSYYNSNSKDLYFFGIKNNLNNNLNNKSKFNFKKYDSNYVINTKKNV
jgi:SAM-dependent methyltransferase